MNVSRFLVKSPRYKKGAGKQLLTIVCRIECRLKIKAPKPFHGRKHGCSGSTFSFIFWIVRRKYSTTSSWLFRNYCSDEEEKKLLLLNCAVHWKMPVNGNTIITIHSSIPSSTQAPSSEPVRYNSMVIILHVWKIALKCKFSIQLMGKELLWLQIVVNSGLWGQKVFYKKTFFYRKKIGLRRHLFL